MLRRLLKQKWLSRGIRRRIADVVLPPRAESFEADCFGSRYRGRLDSYIDREIYLFGDYEPGVLAVLAGLAEARRDVLLDIGANVGQHTLFAARRFREVHAFEPYPPLVAALCDVLSRNQLTGIVRVHAVGLGDVDGELAYGAPADDRAGYGGFDNHDPNLRQVPLPMRRGDSYLSAAGISRVDVLKIDVEGSERRVMTGLTAMLTASRPAIVLEYWPASWPKGLSECLPAHYRTWWIREPGTVWGIFASHSAWLLPFEQAPAGAMVLAMPREWPLPPTVVARGNAYEWRAVS